MHDIFHEWTNYEEGFTCVFLWITVGYAICRVPISPKPNLKRCQQVAVVTFSRATSRDNRVSTL